jgi:alkylation response protein AidB-like acyl-CoA dehydrogenase
MRTDNQSAHRSQTERLRRIDELTRVIRSRARALDDTASFPAETFFELRAAGLTTLTVPVEHGGAGLWSEGRFRDYYELLEALARVDSVTAQLLQVHSHAVGVVAGLSTAEQRSLFMPGVVERGHLMASVGSEAKPSGKLADIARTELEERTPGRYRLTCQKYFASLAPAADELMIWTAVPGEGPYQERSVVVLVPRSAPEVEVIDQWDVMGMRATVSHSVVVSGYDVPPERVIGEPGAWTRRDPRTFTLAFAANHIGAAGAAFEFVTDWVRERTGLAGSELTRSALGTMSSDLFAARAALYAAADLWDQGRYDDAELASIQALHIGKRVALDITQRAFDVCGARAAFRDHALERLYRDVRTFSLHYRDDEYMTQVGRAVVEKRFRAKGYAGASTFPQARA